MLDAIESFLTEPAKEAGAIYNERSLQLELGYHFRCRGFEVEFERPFIAPRPADSTKQPKTNLDLLVAEHGERTAIELKVPLNKRHPETLYDYCADIEFVEALVRDGQVDQGYCLLMTDDHVFWQDSGRGSEIHNCFRQPDTVLTGPIRKPTGGKDTAVVLTGTYRPSARWRDLPASRLMSGARYLLIEARP